MQVCIQRAAMLQSPAGRAVRSLLAWKGRLRGWPSRAPGATMSRKTLARCEVVLLPQHLCAASVCTSERRNGIKTVWVCALYFVH